MIKGRRRVNAHTGMSCNSIAVWFENAGQDKGRSGAIAREQRSYPDPDGIGPMQGVHEGADAANAVAKRLRTVRVQKWA